MTDTTITIKCEECGHTEVCDLNLKVKLCLIAALLILPILIWAYFGFKVMLLVTFLYFLSGAITTAWAARKARKKS